MLRPCRTDNGLCLARIAHPGHGKFGLIQFTDGKVYAVTPMYRADVDLHPSAVTLPGCWFNKDLRARPRFRAVRLTEWFASASTWPAYADYRSAEDRAKDPPIIAATALDRAVQQLFAAMAK